MALISVNRSEIGEVGVTPGIVLVDSTDSLDRITTAGYLNASNLAGTVIYNTDFIAVSYSGDIDWFRAIISHGVITLQTIGPIIILPTIADHIAVFLDTEGTLGEDVPTAINAGNIQAGLATGVAGYFASFPPIASRGSLRLIANPNVGNTLIQIVNASYGQASVLTMPDPGVATANFALLPNATITNRIATYLGTTGLLGEDASTAVNAGNIQAGLGTGTAGYFDSLPASASKGSLRLQAANNVGDTLTTITNASFNQASTLTIPDPGGSSAHFSMLPGVLANGNLIQASGTVGLIADAGVAPNQLQRVANIKAGTTANLGGAGAGPITVPFSLMTINSIVVANISTATTDHVTIEKILPQSGQYQISFSVDPGPICTVNYVVFIAPQ